MALEGTIRRDALMPDGRTPIVLDYLGNVGAKEEELEVLTNNERAQHFSSDDRGRNLFLARRIHHHPDPVRHHALLEEISSKLKATRAVEGNVDGSQVNDNGWRLHHWHNGFRFAIPGKGRELEWRRKDFATSNASVPQRASRCSQTRSLVIGVGTSSADDISTPREQ